MAGTENTPDLLVAWQTALYSRLGVPRQPGLLVPTAKKTALMNVMGPSPSFDASKMSASAIISKPNEDRSEDVVRPLGARLDNHRANPVVFFDHGFSGISVPIAKSEDPDGGYTVKVSKSHVEATSYFCPNVMESCQIFELVTFGIVRATSINLVPIVAKVRSEGRDSYRPGLDVEEWELLEWSWVGIPDNPECLAKVHEMFAKGKLDGQPICEPLLKYFQPFAPERKAVGKGFDSETKSEPKCDDHKDGACPHCGKTKMADDPKPEGEKPADDKPGKEKPGEKPADSDADDEGDEMEKPSAKHLSGLHNALLKMAAVAKACATANENPIAKEHLSAQVEILEGQAGETAACYAKCFPGEPALGDGTVEDIDAKTLAKFLNEGQSVRLRMAGLVVKCEHLAAAENLTAHQKSLAAEVTGRLSKMLGEARAAASKATDNPAGNAADKTGDAPAADPEITKMLADAKALAKRAGVE